MTINQTLITQKDAIKALINATGIHQINIPTKLASAIVPIIDMTPDSYRVCDIVKFADATNTATGTIYTTPATKDFYLCNSELSFIKSSASTAYASWINITVGGVVSRINLIAGIASTAQAQQSSMSFSHPIKVDRSTNITFNATDNSATSQIDTSIIGYTVENPLGV